jgi:hypothetical protein
MAKKVARKPDDRRTRGLVFTFGLPDRFPPTTEQDAEMEREWALSGEDPRAMREARESFRRAREAAEEEYVDRAVPVLEAAAENLHRQEQRRVHAAWDEAVWLERFRAKVWPELAQHYGRKGWDARAAELCKRHGSQSAPEYSTAGSGRRGRPGSFRVFG